MKMLKDSNILETKQDKAWKFVIKRYISPETIREDIPWITQPKIRGNVQVKL